ncbi:DUF6790 family protein [Clostridium sp. LS]|uniref:DUF6790 family protein n=1 Tax=unclassified Clostridium TaxID=2614128 RepID=UPI00030E06DF|nr:DUF6790 family protein [Clostridium sp. LS]
MIAEFIGWEKGSPFQKELGYGISGLLCIWMSKDFWLALLKCNSNTLYKGRC